MALGSIFAGAVGSGGVIGGATVRLTLDSAAFDAGLAKAQGKMAAFGRGMGRVGSAMTRGLTLPIVAIGAVSVKMAMDFEQAFTRISALSNASEKDIRSWKEQVLDLAGTTAQAPEELANALFFLASAGLKSNEIMPALEASAKAAATGMGSLTDIAKLTAASVNAYSESGLTAAESTDTLAAAIKAGSAEPEEFAAGMGRILGVAANVGVEFDELAASLAVLSNVGVDVSEGVTALRGFLLALQAPSAETRDMLDDLGISVQGLRDRIEDDLLGAMRFLFDATGGNIDQLDKLIPNVRALSGFFNITGQEAKKVDDVFQDLAHTTGEVDKAFGETRQDSAFKFKQALTDLKVAAIRVGTVILPVVTEVVEAVGDLAKGFSSMGESARAAWIKVALIAALAGPVLKGFSALIGAATALKVALVGSGAAAGGVAAGGVAGAWSAVGTQAATFGGAQAAVAGGTTSLLGPLAILAATLGGVAFSTKAAMDESKELQGASRDLGDSVLFTGEILGGRFVRDTKAYQAAVEEATGDTDRFDRAISQTKLDQLNNELHDVRIEAGRFGVSLKDSQIEMVRNIAKTDGYAAAVSVLKKMLGDLPPKVIAAILMPGLDAGLRDTRALKDSIAALPASKTIRINILKEGIVPHAGGLVAHSGGEVPAVLQSGEFVINRRATQLFGAANLAAINQGKPAGTGAGVVVNIENINVADADEAEHVGASFGRGLRRAYLQGAGL